MNDEIKEILDRLEKIGFYASVPKELAYMTTNITPQECKTILDYITNLQHENERLKKLEYKFIDTCGENESFTLEEYLDIGNKLYDIEREKEDYKSRIEKAVEYVEQHKFNKFGDIDCGEAEAIIAILNGKE